MASAIDSFETDRRRHLIIIENHERKIEDLLSQPTDSLYLWTKKRLRPR